MDTSTNYLQPDAFYDKDSKLQLFFVSERRNASTQNRPNANLVSKHDVFEYVGHRTIHRDAF